MTRVLRGSTPRGHTRRWQSGNAAVRKTVVFGHRWFESIPAHASGNGCAAAPPKDGCLVRFRAEALVPRISLVWAAVRKTVRSGGVRSPGAARRLRGEGARFLNGMVPVRVRPGRPACFPLRRIPGAQKEGRARGRDGPSTRVRLPGPSNGPAQRAGSPPRDGHIADASRARIASAGSAVASR